MGFDSWDVSRIIASTNQSYKISQKPEDNLDRISPNGYLGKMKKMFDRHQTSGYGVYVVELDSKVWEDSLRRNKDKKSRRWIPSFPMGLPDPKIDKTEKWKDLDTNKAKGFLYVGQTWYDFEERQKKHCRGENSSPVVEEHGCNPSQLWPKERCLTGLFNVENSWMLESWYGWALGECGYVVYGPHFHRSHEGYGKEYEKCVGFMGKNPFW